MNPDDLAHGAAGIALLQIEKARTNGDWAAAHQWVSAATRQPVTAHPDHAGLYRGAPAVAFTLHTAGLPGYEPALETLDRHIATLIRKRLRRAHSRMDHGQLPALREFDLISGLTGLGAYLLHRGHDPDLLGQALDYLVRLTEPIQTDIGPVPGWWCLDGPSERPNGQWPAGGHGNFGIAHGIAGPLALMATASRRGAVVAGLARAIDRICLWFDQWCVDRDRRPWWPGRITAAELRAGAVAQRGPQRPSWCYGTPGIARALQLAGLATGDQRLRQRAERALARCATDAQQLDQLTDATLCHGWSGLLQVIWRCAADQTSGHLHELLDDLQRRYRSDDAPDTGGLLEGREGQQLVQHTIATNQPAATRWDACLLLAG